MEPKRRLAGTHLGHLANDLSGIVAQLAKLRDACLCVLGRHLRSRQRISGAAVLFANASGSRARAMPASEPNACKADAYRRQETARRLRVEEQRVVGVSQRFLLVRDRAAEAQVGGLQ